jgi:protein MpaA
MRTRVLAAVITLALATAGLTLAASPAGAATRTPVLGRKIIGYSVQHRPIIAYHLGNPAVKKTSLLIGQMHGDEHAGITVANSIIDGKVSIEGINLWVIPTMNPDGNAANTRQNAHKVDLNRNWPYRWRHLTGQYYSGTKPLSEPESRAVYKFLRKVQPDYFVSLHQPLYGVDTSSGSVRERAFARTLAHNLHLPSTTLQCWSTCYGSMTDWYDAHKYGLAETVEFGWTPTHAYLVGTARRGIIAAFGGHFGQLKRHNPRVQLRSTATASAVHLAGSAYDIDDRAGWVLVRLYEHGRLLHAHWAQQPSPSLDQHHHLTGGHAFSFDVTATPGRHLYCVYARNIGAGTRNPRTCSTITVAGTS